MKFTIILVFLLATLNGALVEGWQLPCCRCYGVPEDYCNAYCRGRKRCPDPTPDPPPAPVDTYDGYSLFVFGDSFADNGNLPNASTSDLDRRLVRCWYDPYGNSDGKPSGRFSNSMVQSDFVAKMLGLDMAPPPYKQHGLDSCDDTGMTFATGGSGVFPVPVQYVRKLSEQVDIFETLVKSKISPERLAKSVALVAISGNDYDRVGVMLPKDFGGVSAFTRNVTSGIVSSVERLLGLGVPKVLVNNLQPVGCAPSQTKANKYSECDGVGNTTADTHNKNLEGLLTGKNDTVLIVDLHTAFKTIFHEGTEQSRRFKHRYTPCCEATDEGDFCGDTGDSGAGTQALYTLGKGGPDHFFYWDDMHPTQAGWDAVMEQVEGSIKQFVGVA
ncbi:unnamed protein product [Alopecurus aequalis]